MSTSNPANAYPESILPASSKHAEETLKDNEAKYRSLVESSMDAILLTVKDGQILEANAAACEIFQMTLDEICKAGRADLADITDPRLAPLLKERILNGRARGEITCKRKDGTRFEAEITSVIFVDRHGLEKTSMTIRDISERKKAEENLVATSTALQKALNDLNKLMNSSMDVICSRDEKGIFVHVNAASEQVLGYKPDELIGRNYIDFIFPDDMQRSVRADEEIKSVVPDIVLENRFIHKNGSLVNLNWSLLWDEKENLLYGIAKDATEKKILEKAFDVERQRFLDMYSQSPSCMGILKGPNHIYEMANPLYLQLVGKTDIIGKSVKEALPEVERQGVLEFLDNVYNTGKTFYANEMLIQFDTHASGKLVDTYLNFICQAHRNADDQIDGIFFFAINVTEQVLSRKRIEESEKQYKQIVETAQEGICLIDEKDKITFVNTKMAEILEYSAAEITGKEIYSFLDEEGKEIARNLMLKKKEDHAEERHFKYISKSGKAIWTNVSATPLFNEDGTYNGALAMVTDITDRKMFEQNLASKHESLKQAQAIARVGNWEIDLAHNIHTWSDEIYNIFGIKKADVIANEENFMGFCHPEDLKYAYQRIDEGFKNLQNITFEFRFIRNDGSVRYSYNEWKYKFDKNGNAVSLFGIFQDVTDRKLSEIERAKIVNDLILRNNDLEQFTYIVSHNLRAPVANILGIENLLNDPGLSPRDVIFLKEGLRQSVNGLDSVVRDLSQIIQVRNQINETKENILFAEIVDEIKISIKNLIDRENINIESDFNEIESIITLKSYLYSIFYNLISNSIKYRQKHIPGIITIKSRRSENKIELIFTDNGMGIDLQKIGDQVFGLYKRFHLNIEGKGMGLFMVKNQVETLGGKISIQSEVNKGTEFTIEFVC
ncbi:PAS domain-containing sensor histidine kinase [Daejeonella oryzae]|uniref:PAS domain-containing sensor histidine kinase n=1 Tax=Daejeonella oryzae TaxID=1122943 RepID=UPI0003F848B3|nr:PAS domain S-box protein [Daejeonella oryzae]